MVRLVAILDTNRSSLAAVLPLNSWPFLPAMEPDWWGRPPAPGLGSSSWCHPWPRLGDPEWPRQTVLAGNLAQISQLLLCQPASQLSDDLADDVSATSEFLHEIGFDERFYGLVFFLVSNSQAEAELN